MPDDDTTRRAAILAGIADVEAGRTVLHAAVVAWVKQLRSATTTPNDARTFDQVRSADSSS